MTTSKIPRDQGLFLYMEDSLVAISILENKLVIDFDGKKLFLKKNEGHVIYTQTLVPKEKKS